MAEICLTHENFQKEVMESTIPVLIDFWATWCGPCRMMAPIVEEIAEEYEGSIKVAKVNVDDEVELASKFGIVSIPTLVLMKNGQIADTLVGYRPKEAVLAFIGQ
jgi:thioredoxin 1